MLLVPFPGVQVPFAIAYTVLMIVTSVRWSRFTLVGEVPRLGSDWHPGRILPTLGRSAQLTACFVVPVLSLVGLSAAFPGSPMVTALIVVAVPVLGIAGLRLSVMMPAVALARGFGPVEAWRRTRGTLRTCIALVLWALVSMVGMIVVIALFMMLSHAVPPDSTWLWFTTSVLLNGVAPIVAGLVLTLVWTGMMARFYDTVSTPPVAA